MSEYGGAGEAAPFLEDAAVGGDEEGGGDLLDCELARQPRSRIEEQGDVEMPIIGGVEDGVRRGRLGRPWSRGIDDGDAEPSGSVLIGHAGEEDGLAAGGRVRGVGDGLEEREQEGLSGIGEEMELAAADVG